MRIALDLRCVFKGMGGIGRYAWSVFKEFRAIDRENEYVCYFTHLEPPEPITESPRFRVRVFEAGMIDERFDQLVLPTLLAKDSIDLYHNPTFAVPLVGTRARTISTVHDVVFKRHPDLVEPKLRHYLDNATLRAVKTADRLITVSEFSKRELLELYPTKADRVTVIPNGVFPPPEAMKASDSGPRELRERGIVPHSYVLYVGSIEPKKNVGTLLRAFRDVVEVFGDPQLRLIIAGAKHAEDYPLEGRVGELGLTDRVSILGYVTEPLLEALYANARVFVYPSLYEGFGLPPLEAMARGVPTIVSDASSLPEVVGDAALLFDPIRPDLLAKELLRLLKSPGERNALAERGRTRAGRFTWRRSAEAHLGLYKAVVTDRAHTPSCV